MYKQKLLARQDGPGEVFEGGAACGCDGGGVFADDADRIDEGRDEG